MEEPATQNREGPLLHLSATSPLTRRRTAAQQPQSTAVKQPGQILPTIHGLCFAGNVIFPNFMYITWNAATYGGQRTGWCCFIVVALPTFQGGSVFSSIRAQDSNWVVSTL